MKTMKIMLPEGARIIGSGLGVTVAEGEVTGHAHRVDGRAVLIEYHGQRYLIVGGEVTPQGDVVVADDAPGGIDHEEHGRATLASPLLAVTPQQELSLAEEWQRVTD